MNSLPVAETIEEMDWVSYRDRHGHTTYGRVVQLAMSTTGQPFAAIDNFANRVHLGSLKFESRPKVNI